MDVLTEREKKVLALIMDTYISSAEPISSKAIAKTLGNRLSSATIRNVMGNLEELGFLYKPHVVAGRVPTYKAYRYYVNRLKVMRYPGKRDLHVLDSLIKTGYSHVEDVMGDASRVLAAMSRFTSIVVEPRVDMMLFKEIEFVKLSKHTILVVFVTSSGMVHTRLVNSDDDLDGDFLNSMKAYVNERFGGIPFYTLKDRIVEDIRRDKESYARLFLKIRDTLETIMVEEDQREVYIEGASKMIDIPEFSDLERLKELFRALERKEKLLGLLDNCLKKEGMSVIIGGESDVKEMRDMSIITSTYRIGEKSFGLLGVIGPVRMNYSKIIPIVNYAAQRVTDILSMVYEG
jgi:heat-inducible transcriptional repressor